MTTPFRLMFGLSCALISACTPGREYLSGKAANRFFFPDQHQGSIVWRQFISHDPYLGGITTASDPALPTCLVFHHNGLFQHDNGFQVQHGHWYIHSSKEKMAMEYDAGNPKPATGKTTVQPEFRYQIEKVLADTLTLKIQGRHGWVSYTYVLEPEANGLQPLSTPE